MPGGNSRTIVFLAPYAPYAAQGWGSWIVDADGDRRLDLLNNYTALIHGHAHPAVSAAATERLTVVPSMAGRSIGEKFQG